MRVLIFLMIFVLVVVLNFLSLMVKIVFFLGFFLIGVLDDVEEVVVEVGEEVVGREILVMLSFVYGNVMRLMVKMGDLRRKWVYFKGSNKFWNF